LIHFYKRKSEIFYFKLECKMSISNTLSKICVQSEWSDKEEFLDVIYWGRQIIGLVIGLFWGLLPLKGFLGLALFGLLSAGIVYIWFTAVQNIDDTEYGGAWELTKEGFMTSFAGFMVTWIITYSAVHTSI